MRSRDRWAGTPNRAVTIADGSYVSGAALTIADLDAVPTTLARTTGSDRSLVLMKASRVAA